MVPTEAAVDVLLEGSSFILDPNQNPKHTLTKLSKPQCTASGAIHRLHALKQSHTHSQRPEPPARSWKQSLNKRRDCKKLQEQARDALASCFFSFLSHHFSQGVQLENSKDLSSSTKACFETDIQTWICLPEA